MKRQKHYYIIEYVGSAYFEITKHEPTKTTKYTIDVKEKTCGCPYYWIHKKQCKHLKMCEAWIEDDIL